MPLQGDWKWYITIAAVPEWMTRAEAIADYRRNAARRREAAQAVDETDLRG